MKKNFKRTLAAVMAAALTVSLMGTATESDAAKKIKLAKKSITVTKGKSKKVAIKNVKAKKVKKLAVKSSKKKIAAVKKSGKTAIKVTGKKAGSAKVTVSVTLKGKKKATKLTLKVKVKNAKKGGSTGTNPTAAPSTTAPAATNAPGGQTAAPGGQGTQAPGTQTGAPETKAPAETKAPTAKPPATADPWGDGQFQKPETAVSQTLTYTDDDVATEENPDSNGGNLQNCGEAQGAKILFKNGVGYKDKIDILAYDKIVVKVAATKELEGDGSWFGKVALNSTDTEIFGFYVTDDAFGVKYINDMPYTDGVYEVTFPIPDSITKDAATPAEISQYVDCISVQLANKDEYANLIVKEIAFVGKEASDETPAPGDQTPDPNATKDPNATEKPVVTADPNATKDPNATADPDATKDPNATEKPAVTEKPVVTAKPVAPTVTIKGQDKIQAGKTTEMSLAVSNGEVTDVTWATADEKVATVAKNPADAKKATVTGVAEGTTKVTAEVKVTVGGQEFTVTAEADLEVVPEDALIVNATIESTASEFAIGETAGIEVTVDTGAIESIEWTVEGDAATVETDGVEALLTGVGVGEVTITAKVTVKAGDKTAEDTVKATFTVTPITYSVGKELQNTTDNEELLQINLDTPITVKKTDIVKAVLSSDDTDAKFSVYLSTYEGATPTNTSQNAEIEMEKSMVAGTVDLVRNDLHFKSNFVDITKIVVRVPAQTEVKVEKVLIIPTDEIAVSISGLSTIEKGETSDIAAEIAAEDFDSIEWVSSDSTVASVQKDAKDETKAVVTGVKEGTATISAKIIKDGKEVKKEDVEFTITKQLKGQAYEFDLSKVSGYDSTSQTLALTSNTILHFPNGSDGSALTVGAGQKVKFTFDYEIPTGGNDIRAYIVVGDVDKALAVESSQNVPAEKTITCTATETANGLMVKGINYGQPNVKIKSIKMEFVD